MHPHRGTAPFACCKRVGAEVDLTHGDSLLKMYLAHRVALVDVVAPIVGCRFRAEDVVQDAYLKLSESKIEADIRQPVSYLFRLVRNLAIDRARRLALEVRRGADAEVPIAAPAPDPSPEETLAARDMLRALERALRELPDRTRLVFEMSRVSGYSTEQIAQALGISVSLVYLLLRDAMTHCRKRLFDTDNEPP